MTRDEILRLLARFADTLVDIAAEGPDALHDALKLRADIYAALADIKPTERLGVPFDA